jgi:hypothetical protein
MYLSYFVNKPPLKRFEGNKKCRKDEENYISTYLSTNRTRKGKEALYRFLHSACLIACSSGRAVLGVGLRPLACCDCQFDTHRGHGCLSVVFCQVEVSTSS